MKIWRVDYAGFSPSISSRLFFVKEEAEDFDKSWSFNCAYHKLYQVDDVWGWCARNFDKVLYEIITSRDNGENYTYIWGMVNEIKEAAEHCGVEQFNVNAFWTKGDEQFVLSVCWCHDGKLHHYTDWFYGIDTPYNCPTITERRSEWWKN